MTEQQQAMSRGEAIARAAVLEGYVPVPSVVVEFLKGAGTLEGLWFGESGVDRGAFWWRKYLLAAAPAPVERPADGDKYAHCETVKVVAYLASIADGYDPDAPPPPPPQPLMTVAQHNRIVAAARAVAGLEFTLVHPADGETHTVTLTREEVQEQMADELYEKLGELICHCEPVGETNVVDCNCIDRIEGFEIAAHPSGGAK